MTTYVAFLRAINVGKRRIKMDALRAHFEPLGFGHIKTYIASGNVIFEADETDVVALETRIEKHLHEVLGYEVDTFIRTAAELAAIVQHRAFEAEMQSEDDKMYIGFLKDELSTEAIEAVMAQQSEIDFFHIHQREFYWLCRRSISQSDFSAAKLEKTIKLPTTLRNVNTAGKLAEMVNK